jgi:hypothetical protein
MRSNRNFGEKWFLATSGSRSGKGKGESRDQVEGSRKVKKEKWFLATSGGHLRKLLKEGSRDQVTYGGGGNVCKCLTCN